MASPFHTGPPAVVPGEGPIGAVAPHDLQRLRDTLRLVRSVSEVDDEVAAGLETAYEELRVADEEVRVQHEEITRLVRLHEQQRAEHERLIAVLPVPVLVTDGYGVVRLVNAAAAVLAGARPEHMVGKPVFSFFAPESRRGLRALLARLQPGADGRGRETGRFVNRRGESVPVEVTLSSTEEGERHVSWLVLPAGSSPGANGSAKVPECLARLASLPASELEPVALLAEVVDICRDLFGRGASCTIALGSPLAPTAVVSTGPGAQSLDGAQLRAGAGPSAEAHGSGEVVWSEDLRVDGRWPGLAGDADRLAAAGAIAAPLLTHGRVRGVLTVYRDLVGADAHLRETVQTVALTVAGLLQERDLVEDVRRARVDMDRALASRAVIEQAKGIVMGEKGVSAAVAFDHLVDLASTQHVKLREVAAGIVDAAQGRGDG